MKRLLLLGASGFLGWHLCRVLGGAWDIHALSRANLALHTPKGLGPRTSGLADIRDPAALAGVFASIRPDAVLNAAALSDPNRCQLDPEESRAVNLTAALNVAELCAERAVPLVFISTDLVFDGTAAPYAEPDQPRPLSVYGEHKALAEQGVLARHPAAAVCRLPLLYGEAGGPGKSFLQGMLAAIAEGRELTLFEDEFRTPVSGRDAALGLGLVLERGIRGLLHLGGPERLSRLEFGRLLAQALPGENVRIRAARRADAPMPAPRPADVSLDSNKAFGLGFSPRTVREELSRILPH